MTKPNTVLPLYRIMRDPFVRAAFERAARDSGSHFAIPATPNPILHGPDAKQMEAA